MTDLGQYSHLSSRELHQLLGYEEAGLDSVEAFNTALLLYEQLSVELYAQYRFAFDHIQAYYEALAREGFRGLPEAQVQIIQHTYEKIQRCAMRIDRLKEQLLDFSFLHKIPDQDIQQSLSELVMDGSLDADSIADLFDAFASDNAVDRLEAAEQAIFSASSLFRLEAYGAGRIARPGSFMIPSVSGVGYVGYASDKIDPSVPFSKQQPSHVLRTALKPRHLRLMREVPLTERLKRRTSTLSGGGWAQTLGLPEPREGYMYLPLASEFHYTIRRAYGSTTEHRNRLLEYQDSIRRGLIAGAIIELRGKVDADFLRWILGETAGELGPVPDVEIAYSMPLPSGDEYRFPIKLPNDIHSSTPYGSPHAFLDLRDRAIV